MQKNLLLKVKTDNSTDPIKILIKSIDYNITLFEEICNLLFTTAAYTPALL